MHQSIGKRNKIIIYLIMLIFLTSLNNKNFSSFIKEKNKNLKSQGTGS